MRNFNYFIATFLLAIAPTLNAAEFKSMVHVGLDSNPHHLNADLGAVQEEFAVGQFESKSDYDELFFWDLGVEKSAYNNDARADELKSHVDLKFASDFDLFDHQYRYYLGGNYSSLDKTFVSQQTGLVASVNGVSLADRFDHETKGGYLGLIYPQSQVFDYIFEYSEAGTDYKSVELAELDDLNHHEQTFTFGINYRTQNKGRFYFALELNERNYDLRQDRDLEGVFIPDTQLSYTHIGFTISYHYQPEEGIRWDYAFNYVNRYSSGTTFYDAQRAKIEINGEYRIADYHLLDANLTYQTFYFDDNFDQPYELLDPDEVEQRGARLQLEYTWILATLFDTNLAFYANLEASSYDSPQATFIYKQNKASAGIRWAMD